MPATPAAVAPFDCPAIVTAHHQSACVPRRDGPAVWCQRLLQEPHLFQGAQWGCDQVGIGLGTHHAQVPGMHPQSQDGKFGKLRDAVHSVLMQAQISIRLNRAWPGFQPHLSRLVEGCCKLILHK